MLLPSHPSNQSVALTVRHKRTHSEALGLEDTRNGCDCATVHSTEYISNDICRDLDIGDKNKPESLFDNAITDDNTPRNDIATSDTAADSTRGSIAVEGPIEEGAIEDDLTTQRIADEGFTDEGIADHESTCSTETVKPRDTKVEILWGRTYLIDQWQPQDEKSSEFWRKNHNLCLVLFDNVLHKAEMRPSYHRVLDIGSENGDWAMDFADKHPGLGVTSIDLKPPGIDFVPPNLRFELVKNFDLKEQKSPQDFIHISDLKGRITDWDTFTKGVFNILTPDGVAEFHEWTIEFKCNRELPQKSFMKEWGDLFLKASIESKARFDVVESKLLTSSIKAAGFIDITEHCSHVPVGSWPEFQAEKELGELALAAFTYDIEGSIFRLASDILGWSKSDCGMFASNLRRELKNTTINPYMTRLIVVCKRPSS